VSVGLQETQPIKLLAEKGVDFSVHRFDYVIGGGTKRSSSELGVDEHAIVKTLIFETQDRSPLVVLMHGDLSVDTKKLAGELGVTKIWSCSPTVAENLSGWPVGATNPFALKTIMPIFLEASVMDLPRIYINGGGRGLLVSMSPVDLSRVVQIRLVRCAREKPVVVSKAP